MEAIPSDLRHVPGERARHLQRVECIPGSKAAWGIRSLSPKSTIRGCIGGFRGRRRRWKPQWELSAYSHTKKTHKLSINIHQGRAFPAPTWTPGLVSGYVKTPPVPEDVRICPILPPVMAATHYTFAVTHHSNHPAEALNHTQQHPQQPSRETRFQMLKCSTWTQ